MPRILLIGGSGFIGRNMIKGLKTDGYEIILMTRNPGEKKYK